MNLELIKEQLSAVADPARKEAVNTMFPTSMEYLGVRTPDFRVLLRNWQKEFRKQPPGKLVEFARQLVETGIFELNQLAFEMLWKNKTALELLRLDDIEFLGKNMDNWATTDAFSVMISGFAWQNGQISDEDVLHWLESENRWWRRAAIVSTVGLNLKSRGGTGDTRRTLMICEKVTGDRDAMIVKALSWALRELSKHDKPAVAAFMKRHETELANRVRREVLTKLTTGKKSG